VFVRQKSQRSTWPEIFPFAARPYAERLKGERIRNELGSEEGSKPKGRLKFARRFLRRILKLALAALSISTLVLVGGPSFISLPVGLNAVLYLMNVVIPGTISVGSASLGWTMPACLKQITLTGVEGKTVLSIVELETQSPLWSLIAGRSGLGNELSFVSLVLLVLSSSKHWIPFSPFLSIEFVGLTLCCQVMITQHLCVCVVRM
jgi:hypothetical protein